MYVCMYVRQNVNRMNESRIYRELKTYDATKSTTRSEFQGKNKCLVIYLFKQILQYVLDCLKVHISQFSYYLQRNSTL